MRHAFALALDLAVRRDPVQSLLVPLLLRAPWILALWLLPSPDSGTFTPRNMVLGCAALIGDYLMLLVVTAMLRFRARSVFNRPRDARPLGAIECYAQSLGRLPWLVVTEIARNVAIVVAMPFLVLPAVLLAFRLAFATESVVLNGHGPGDAFRRSFQLTEGRFERWLEMIATSVTLVISVAFLGAVLSVIFPAPGVATWAAISWLTINAVTPIVQYAWTFFYLRLVEVEEVGFEVPPAYARVPAAAPALVHAASGEAVASADAAVAEPAHAPKLALVERGRSAGEPYDA